ncbi:uncharacterized protein BcabD6B2_55330 [Babesia caballi]|uniref:Uncharacterized protein n=1 Tax=Babesia caballi TaxID=5871 RepID=A0AAV4M0U4_BABCB|nr:hypothetical protein, conserved [Babesia caballi]
MDKKDLTDCPSNLKEAIDWIMRVTGKDGRGSDNTRALARAVKGLLGKAVKDVNSLSGRGDGNGPELDKLKEGLQKAVKWVEEDLEPKYAFKFGPIGQLSIALRDFIGYTSYGVLSDSSLAGKITGAGIAPSNMATHRLCDAAIAFTIGVLEGCRNKHKTLGMNGTHTQKIDAALTALHGCYGKGPEGLKKLANNMCGLENFSGSSVGQFVKQLGNAFNDQLKGLQSSGDSVETVAETVGKYFKDVFKKGNGHWGDPKEIESKLKELAADFKSSNKPYDVSTLSHKIKNVGEQLEPTQATVKPILTAGKKAFMDHLKKRNYSATNYNAQSVEWNSDSASFQTCAKIFLGCLPLYYQALTYLYWRCHENGGGWNTMNLGGGPLKDILYSMWYDPSRLHVVKRGQSVVSVLDEKFAYFRTAMSQKRSYPQFLQALQENAKQKLSSAATECPLSALYYCASYYFTCKQSQINAPTKSPSTIREMLYFLAALPFSLSYEGMEKHIGDLLKNDLDVADSAQKSNGNKLSADNIKDYIISSLLLPPSLLGVIQDNSESKDEPLLHDLYSNFAFNFNYPSSGAALFYALADYTYALQFQLGFLYQQCSQLYVNTCGWFMCTFGKDINTTLTTPIVASHICSVGCSNHNSDKFSDHMNGDCEHAGCGTSKPSPLQAFLTDNLPGFCRGHPSDPSSHLATCSGSLCHVPMGFDGHLRPGRVLQGGHISHPHTILRQLHLSPPSTLRKAWLFN